MTPYDDLDVRPENPTHTAPSGPRPERPQPAGAPLSRHEVTDLVAGGDASILEADEALEPAGGTDPDSER